MNTYTCSLCESFDVVCHPDHLVIYENTIPEDAIQNGVSPFKRLNESINKSRIWTIEMRAKIANDNRKRIISAETRAKTSESNKKRDPKYKQKIIDDNKMRKCSCVYCNRIIATRQLNAHIKAKH